MKTCEACGREYPDGWLMCPPCQKRLGRAPPPEERPADASRWPIPVAFGLAAGTIGSLVVRPQSLHVAVAFDLAWLFLVYLGSLVWVGWDSGRRDWSRTGRFWPGKAWLWVLAMTLGWALVFPLYTIARRKAPLRAPEVPEP